jgi:dTDP-4-dehydrorhamnose 3,5-epimerase-like enzyme
MAYVVTINPGFGRDMDRWHYHHKKTEIFVCVNGETLLTVKDNWSGDYYTFTLSDNNCLMITVEPEERHSVINRGTEPATVLVYCTTIYDAEDELRMPMDEEWNWPKWLMNHQ